VTARFDVSVGPTTEELAGLWRLFPSDARGAWLAATYARWFAFAGQWPVREPGTTIDLDGSVIDDLNGFLCAIGEAVNGPAGYFGRTLLGLSDCAAGGFGIEAPWTLRVSHATRLRNALGVREAQRYEQEQYASGNYAGDEERAAAEQRIAELRAGHGGTLLDQIVEILRDRNVTVELA
jgi:Barstar (barnase inhibitor)